MKIGTWYSRIVAREIEIVVGRRIPWVDASVFTWKTQSRQLKFGPVPTKSRRRHQGSVISNTKSDLKEPSRLSNSEFIAPIRVRNRAERVSQL